MVTKGKKKPDALLLEDVAEMILDATKVNRTLAKLLAADIIIVTRERFLQEIQSYARQNIR